LIRAGYAVIGAGEPCAVNMRIPPFPWQMIMDCDGPQRKVFTCPPPIAFIAAMELGQVGLLGFSIGSFIAQQVALLQRLSCLQMPVFVANGDSDPMILPHYSYLLAGLIPQAQVKIYPDSAHGFLFQHHAEFAADVEAFLSQPG
jgi:alpha-beta hydrolase superfamily lysophospholipase